MGAWGRNVFQNDTALDIVDEVLDGTFDLDEFRRNFRRDEDEGYLTASQGAALLTLGALVRIARNEDHADLEALLEHGGMCLAFVGVETVPRTFSAAREGGTIEHLDELPGRGVADRELVWLDRERLECTARAFLCVLCV